MRRLPALAFIALVAATAFAFFLTQHLKTRLPVVEKQYVVPQAFNPISGQICTSRTDEPLDYRKTVLKFILPQAGTVGVYVVNNAGRQIATVSKGASFKRNQVGTFTWNGREANGTDAPDGTYFFEISLLDQARTVDLRTLPVTIMTHSPHPRLSLVTLNSGTGTSSASAPVMLTPGLGSITASFRNDDYRRAYINIYRTDLSGPPRLVQTINVKSTLTAAPDAMLKATWNGEVTTKRPVGTEEQASATTQPAAAGTYLVGMTAEDQACNSATYPVATDSGAPGMGVTVSYLAASPPLAPTAAGSRAAVVVDSPTGSYTWQLRLAGRRKVLRHGSGSSGTSTLRVWLPAKQGAALYALTLKAGAHKSVVPLVADASGGRAQRARVLVVLPTLTWQGESQVDNSGDGLPSTLSAGDQVKLDRPLVDGLPASFTQDAALLAFLKGQGLNYQLTTDVALSEGVGPALVDRWGVALAGSETWLPASLGRTLTGFVRGGGRVLSIGTDALKGIATITGYPSDPVASAPVTSQADIFGATHGPLISTHGYLITELTDQLGILASAPAFSGFKAFSPIEPPSGAEASLAGIATAPAIAAFKLGSGYVVEVGLDGFNSSLASNIDASDLMTRVWQLLAKGTST